MSVHFLVDKLHKRLEEVEAGSGLNCLDDAGDVDVVDDGDDIGSKVGRGWRFSTREGDSGDYWKITKQRTPGELLARERKVAKTSLFQQLNRVSCKTEVFVFPVL